jgi:DeoR/GlpR family transcriptional regulator of sugar metabolism
MARRSGSPAGEPPSAMCVVVLFSPDANEKEQPVLAGERQQRLVQRVEAEGFVKVQELTEEFGVSAMTVRRDIAELEHRGLVRRVRGGAASLHTRDIGYGLRERMNRREKEDIGRRAAELVRPGATVFIDAGTTCIEVARHLVKRQLAPLYLVTASVKVTAELAGLNGVKVMQLGGEIYDQSFGAVGEAAVRKLARLRLDWAFLGASGVDLELGMTNNNHFEVQVKRAALKSARRGVFLADSSKLGRASLARVVAIDEPHTLITTDALSCDDKQMLEARGWEVIVTP